MVIYAVFILGKKGSQWSKDCYLHASVGKKYIGGKSVGEKAAGEKSVGEKSGGG